MAATAAAADRRASSAANPPPHTHTTTTTHALSVRHDVAYVVGRSRPLQVGRHGFRTATTKTRKDEECDSNARGNAHRQSAQRRRAPRRSAPRQSAHRQSAHRQRAYTQRPTNDPNERRTTRAPRGGFVSVPAFFFLHRFRLAVIAAIVEVGQKNVGAIARTRRRARRAPTLQRTKGGSRRPHGRGTWAA